MWEKLLAQPGTERSPWEPQADVYSSLRRWLVKLDLAGVRPEDVEVRARGRSLLIRWVRRDGSVFEGCRAYSMEISYHRFERAIELPFDLDSSRIRTDYRDGMFFLEILTGTDE